MTIDGAGFERLYRADPDPFDVATSWYEQRKQSVLLASLGRTSYDVGWDCASGTGALVLALRSGARCREVVASDVSAAAVALTRDLVIAVGGVSCLESALPDVPEAARSADLTLVTEVLYYLPEPARRTTLAALARQRGELVSVHWRHHPHDAHLSGTAVTTELADALEGEGWTPTVRHDDVDFVLAAWTRDAP